MALALPDFSNSLTPRTEPANGCPYGTTWNGRICKPNPKPGIDGPNPEGPAPENTYPNSTNCPSGETYDSVAQKCLPTCPPGQARSGPGEGSCVEVGGGGGTSSSGTGTGTGTSPFSSSTKPYEFTPWSAPAKTPFEIDIQSQISDFLKNYDKSVPYTPEVISNMRTDAFKDTYGRTNANKAAIEADAIQRGVLRSSGTDRRLDNRANAADAAYAQGNRDITNVSTQANFEAVQKNRLDALDRAQNHLDREREYLLASETNDFRRQQGLAQLAFGYYGLEQERWALTQSINNSNYQFGQNMDWNKLLLQWQILQGAAA